MNSGRGSRGPWLGAALICLAAWPAWAQTPGNATAEQAKGVEAALGSLVAAFNAHDAEKLAGLWTADAVHQARETGAKLEGRAAIAGAYEKLFKADPHVQLQLQLVSLRKVSPEVASLEVLATVQHTDRSTTHSELNVLLARVNDAWQVDEVRETEFSAPAGNPIESLGWLVGQWSDESQQGLQITNSAEWTPGRQFLARSYRQQREGEVLAQGLEIIGWDASAGQLRCWLFASDGSFAHGSWLPQGPNRWLIKLAGQRPDGVRGSLTQVLERTGDNQLTLQIIDRDWDGAPLPNGQVNTLTRRSEAAPSTDAPSNTRPAPEAK
ncbi:MAG: nuclear transport factor 2 family protein [Pirellulales bacterium]